jgi:hypothetical protein
MGLFGWVTKHVFHPVEDAVSDGWHAVDDFGHDALHDVVSWSSDVGRWLAKRWKPITAALIAGVTFAAIFCLCPEFGPALLAWAMPGLIAGLASGAAGQTARDLFDHKTPGTDLIVPALLSAVLTVGGMGLGKLALGTAIVESRPLLASVIANLTGATQAGDAAGDAAATAGSAFDTFKKKLGFILVNVSPGPSDYEHIIKGDGDGPSEPASKIPEPPPSVTRGFDSALDSIGESVPHDGDHTGGHRHR